MCVAGPPHVPAVTGYLYANVLISKAADAFQGYVVSYEISLFQTRLTTFVSRENKQENRVDESLYIALQHTKSTEYLLEMKLYSYILSHRTPFRR